MSTGTGQDSSSASREGSQSPGAGADTGSPRAEAHAARTRVATFIEGWGVDSAAVDVTADIFIREFGLIRPANLRLLRVPELQSVAKTMVGLALLNQEAVSFLKEDLAKAIDDVAPYRAPESKGTVSPPSPPAEAAFRGSGSPPSQAVSPSALHASLAALQLGLDNIQASLPALIKRQVSAELAEDRRARAAWSAREDRARAAGAREHEREETLRAHDERVRAAAERRRAESEQRGPRYAERDEQFRARDEQRYAERNEQFHARGEQLRAAREPDVYFARSEPRRSAAASLAAASAPWTASHPPASPDAGAIFAQFADYLRGEEAVQPLANDLPARDLPELVLAATSGEKGMNLPVPFPVCTLIADACYPVFFAGRPAPNQPGAWNVVRRKRATSYVPPASLTAWVAEWAQRACLVTSSSTFGRRTALGQAQGLSEFLRHVMVLAAHRSWPELQLHLEFVDALWERTNLLLCGDIPALWPILLASRPGFASDATAAALASPAAAASAAAGGKSPSASRRKASAMPPRDKRYWCRACEATGERTAGWTELYCPVCHPTLQGARVWIDAWASSSNPSTQGAVAPTENGSRKPV